MNGDNDENLQDFERWLATPGRPKNEKLFRSVLAATQPVLRRRRLAGYVFKAAAFAACYLIGLGTIPLLSSLNPPVVPAGSTKADKVPVLMASRSKPKAASPRRARECKAPAVKRLAAADDSLAGSRFEMYRSMGDRALEKDKDRARAAIYYAKAVRGATNEQLEISYSNDSLLLIEAKDSLLKERSRSKDRDDVKPSRPKETDDGKSARPSKGVDGKSSPRPN